MGKEKYESYTISLTVDSIFPLADGTYQMLSRGINGITLSIQNKLVGKQNVGSLTAHGNGTVLPQSKMGIGAGKAKLSLTYHLTEPATEEEFSEQLSISPIWHFSPTGWDFILLELNRIVDLYRCQTNAYWWYHIGMWDIEELVIYGRPIEASEDKAITKFWPKIMNFGENPLDDSAYAVTSSYVKSITGDQSVPFYHLLYMNGRRSLAEHSFREALVNWANCIEAYSIYMLDGACKLANMEESESNEIFAQADTYKSRISKAYQILSDNDVYPSIKKKAAMKFVDTVMEHRNEVMHGNNPDLNWQKVSSKYDALNELLGIPLEVFRSISHRL